MDFNFSKILKKNIPYGTILPRRSLVYVGFLCHQKCGFCYYKSRCSDLMFRLDDIYKQIDFLYEYGIRDFEITGGEPSEYLQLREVCEYIKNKDCNSKIAVITNGGLFRSDIWNIIDEVLISYHLSNKTTDYDKNMFPLGSTYDKVRKTIDKARSYDKIIRMNVVIGTFNFNSIDDIVNDLVEFNPMMINFLPVNLFDDATSMKDYIDYDLLRVLLKKSIDKLHEAIPNAIVFIRYMPFCDMVGYEQHIVGHAQHIYDWFDWNIELSGPEFISKINDDFRKKLGSYGSTSFDEIDKVRKQLYYKSTRCLKCKYFMICDGVEKSDKNILDKYIKPEYGNIIKNPMYYLEDKSSKIYHKLYKI